MPKIYDNKEVKLVQGLEEALERSFRSDICTSYFNLRGWKRLAGLIDQYRPEEDGCCRLLLGMYGPGYHLKKEILEEDIFQIDRSKAKKLKQEAVKRFKSQLMLGIPSNEDERGLRMLARQIREKKVVVKCFTRHPLHAKLYMTFNKQEFAGKIGFLGSSNLTFAGLEKQGELNIDVLDQQTCETLCQWFEEKWSDKFSLDISQEIVEIIESSWAGEEPYLPYHIYVKMAWHLSEDARKGLTDFFIPKDLKETLFDFQSAAVRIATHYVSSPKNGVLIGDVVGLGKTFMAITVAKILEEEHGWQTLVICPKNLAGMWDDYIQKYGVRGRVLPSSQIQQKLPSLKRHHVVIIDESHGFRNPQGKRYKILKDYIEQNESKCILLSATPYNKTYHDLSSQLGLFLGKDDDLGIRPTKFLSEEGQNFEGVASSLKAFEKSDHPEDWQQLMSQFLIRRTRSFIKNNYGQKSSDGRYYLKDQKNQKRFFPKRLAKTVKYEIDEQYRKLFSESVVKTIEELNLSRYDLNKYKKGNLVDLTREEQDIFKDLEQSRAHPKGFCRIGLFKRLESSGFAFLKSIQRHVLRNCIFIYAIENDESLMIKDKSSDIIADIFDDEEGGITGFSEKGETEDDVLFLTEMSAYLEQANKAYEKYRQKRSLRWIKSSYFNKELLNDLMDDTEKLISLLNDSKEWNPQKDLKIKELEKLIKEDCVKKAVIFSQSKETAEYLKEELTKRGVAKIGLATGGMEDISKTIKCFSPKSNNFSLSPKDEIDILVATDVLSEGQNLQDCNTVINYDLPWAIIKLVQRVGRVDRIGQESEEIYCHSFMPNEGLEELIKLKSRIQKRLKESAEVIGTDERFFKDEKQVFLDLYSEKSEVLERELMEDVDLPSYALEIWNRAIKDDPSLEDKIKNMPDSVHSSKKSGRKGVLLFAKSQITNDLLELDAKGSIVSENQKEILDKASCGPETPSGKKMEEHYDIVKKGLGVIEEGLYSMDMAGRLGASRSPRKKLYDLLKKAPGEENELVLDNIFEYPLLSDVEGVLSRMFRRKVMAKEILDYVGEKYRNGALVNKKEAQRINEKPRIICSMGLVD